MIRSIFSKLFISYLAVILVVALTLSIFLSFLVRSHIIENERLDLLQKGQSVVALLEPAIASGHTPNPLAMQMISRLTGSSIWISDAEGNVLAGSPPPRWARAISGDELKIKALFDGEPQSWVRTGRRQADPAIVVAVPLTNTTRYALFLDTPITGVNRTARALEELLLYAALLGVLAAGAVSFFISRSFTRPISAISQAASRFADGDFSSRSSVSGGDEIGSLGNTFNSMADSLANIEQNRRDFLANISHELKTPIASIRALTEAIIDGIIDTPEGQQRYLGNIVKETERIGRLISELSDLSALEAGKLSIHLQNLNLKNFLSAETDKYISLLNDKKLNWSISIPENIPFVQADPDRLSQVFANLVTNAVRYAPEGSAIALKLNHGKNFVTVSVSDSGPGIAPDDLPHIWERFYRADKSRSRHLGGSGLGLFITRNLVHAMGGDITVESLPGKGATFSFTIPVSDGKSR